MWIAGCGELGFGQIDFDDVAEGEEGVVQGLLGYGMVEAADEDGGFEAGVVRHGGIFLFFSFLEVWEGRGNI